MSELRIPLLEQLLFLPFGISPFSLSGDFSSFYINISFLSLSSLFATNLALHNSQTLLAVPSAPAAATGLRGLYHELGNSLKSS